MTRGCWFLAGPRAAFIGLPLLRLALMRRLPLRELQRRRLQTPAHPARPHLILRRRLLSIPRNV
jgi:hypothetical protein